MFSANLYSIFKREMINGILFSFWNFPNRIITIPSTSRYLLYSCNHLLKSSVSISPLIIAMIFGICSFHKGGVNGNVEIITILCDFTKRLYPFRFNAHSTLADIKVFSYMKIVRLTVFAIIKNDSRHFCIRCKLTFTSQTLQSLNHYL